MRRVVITGMGVHSSLGHDWVSMKEALVKTENTVQTVEEWSKYEGLNARLAAPCDFTTPSHYSRKQTRGMGRVSLMAVSASEMALKQAGLLDDPEFLQSGKIGVAYGSSSGSPPAMMDFGRFLVDESTSGITATTYIRMMSHTAAVNVGLFFKLQGRLIPTSSACTSGSQAIGFAYESIRSGAIDAMIAGGAEELCPTQVAIFDTLFATSTRNSEPHLTPRPYDVDRDGLVIGEGASSLILEEYEHAKARGATILAEIVGFGTNLDGCHVTQPQTSTMAQVMKLSLEQAGMTASDIGYCSADGTATQHGDIAESKAVESVLGSNVPMSSLKSYIGHTLGACGAIEAFACVNMLHDGWVHPTVNLQNVDPNCGDLDYVREQGGRSVPLNAVMSNNFAFGGINTSLILCRA